jgi:ABC-type thiamin/hydroxymethylpyrimidine transport system permease subunit
MRFRVRDLVYIGVFGALWGAVETTLGSVVHTLNVPFSGAVLTGIGITIALIGRLFVPRTGSVLFIGLVTACLKMFSLGGIVLSPMLGIVMESFLAEATLTVLGRPRRLSFMLAGALATLWTLVHPFLTQGILAGSGILTIYERTLTNGARSLGLDPSVVLLVLAALIGLHLAIGGAAGWLAWDAGRVVQARLRPAGTADAA